MPILRIRVSDQTFEAPLPEGPVRIGTDAGCDLTLACEGVAREHCLLEPMAGGAWRLKDLVSGRPTLVNGTEVRQVSLRPGDTIAIGAAEIEYDPENAAAVTVPRARAAAPAPLPVRPAEPAPDEAASAPLATTAIATDAAAPARAPARAPGTPAPTAGPREAPGRRRLLLPVLLLALVGAGLAVAGLVGTGGDDGATEARARRDLDAAIERVRARDFLGAQQDLKALLQRVRTGDVARQAETYLQSATEAVADAERELETWTARALDFDLSAAATRRDSFLHEHGRSFEPKVEQALAAVRADHDRWRKAEAERVEEEAAAFVADGKYREARARWVKSRASAPRGVAGAFDADVAAALARVDAAAETGATALLERVERAVTARGPGSGAEMLSSALAHYEGTSAQARLGDRMAALAEAAKEKGTSTPTPAPSTPSPGPAPGTKPPAPATADATAVLARVKAEVAQAVGERAFAKAVDRVDAGLAQVGDGPAKQELTLRRGDLGLARNGLDALAGDLTATPTKYGRIELAANLFAAPTSADRDGITVAVTGGTTRLRWATMSKDLLAGLVEKMKPTAQDALLLASLLHEVGATAAYERMLVRAGEGGTSPSILFELLARWRGEPVPEGGYVAYEDRYVSTAERDRLVLASRIRGAVERFGSARDAAGRKAAVDDLLALGEPARASLEKALRDRRAQLSDELVARKVWSSARTQQRLHELLEKRRAAALQLIEDEAAYPYPNPTHQGQAEVERHVDQVREVWERPFGLVAGFDDDVRKALDLVTEVDEGLARVVPGYRPDLGLLEAAASRAVDMPSYAPPGAGAALREYSLKVLAFNERVATSASREEKDNVRAVNEYRMMMGRAAVKIEERLVRAARGHSRHMRDHQYFAHDAPASFPEVRTPGHRARRQGYAGGVGENIAWGTPTGRDAFKAWFGSSGHHRNMLGRGWTEMGAGHALPSHWTQNFGALSGKSLNDPAALPPPAPEVAPEPEGGRTPKPDEPVVPRVPDEKPPGEPPDLPKEDVPSDGGK